jgi:hypothetical protein
MSDVRVIIVGGGPHALAVSCWLTDAGVAPGDLVVIDPSGRFMTSWNASFKAQGIDRLRSPMVHHPHPDPFALSKYAERENRLNEFYGRYRLPGSQLFADFCLRLVHEFGLDALIKADRVTRVDPDGTVALVHGGEIRGTHVVLAHNPCRPVWPTWAHSVPGVRHAAEIRLDEPLPGSVLVIGGGLTAAQLASGASARGCDVTLMTRRLPVARHFDTEAGWLGPREMTGYLAEGDYSRRLSLARQARGGGSIPPWMLGRLNALTAEGRLDMLCGEVIETQRGMPLGVTVSTADGGVRNLVVDEVWLATGWQTDGRKDPLVGPLLSQRRSRNRASAVEVDGHPVLDRLLRVGGTQIHVGGRLATLHLGPTSGNLAGARRLAECVTESVVGSTL